MYSVLKKVLEYRYPLYRSTGTRFKKLFLSIVFTILKKSYFLNIQPVHLGFVCAFSPLYKIVFAPFYRGSEITDTKKNPAFRDIIRRRGVRVRVRGAGAAFLCTTNRGKLLQRKLIPGTCTVY